MSDDRFQDLDEPFPEDRGSGDADETGAPEVAAPEVESPSENLPTPSSPSARAEELEALAADVDSEFKALFWKLVLLYKVAIIGLALGILLTVFGTFPTRGPILAAGSAILLLYALVRTQQGKARLDSGEFDLDVERQEESPQQGDHREGSDE